MIGETELRAIQRKIQQGDRSTAVLNGFSFWIIKMTGVILASIRKKTGYVFNPGKKEELGQEASLACSHELLNRGKSINCYRSFIWTVISRKIYSKKEKLKDSIPLVPIEDAYQVDDKRGLIVDEPDAFEHIEQSKDGKKVIILLYNNRFYRDALLAIEKLKGLDWICINAKKLRYVFLKIRERGRKWNDKQS